LVENHAAGFTSPRVRGEVGNARASVRFRVRGPVRESEREDEAAAGSFNSWKV
jgi:hypothetical protein